jgi:hypothetical protein
MVMCRKLIFLYIAEDIYIDVAVIYTLEFILIYNSRITIKDYAQTPPIARLFHSGQSASLKRS